MHAGKSCATVESGKWVCPAKSAAGGEVAAVNEELVAKPSLANDDPYGAGWMVILKPADWNSVKPTLVPGTSVAAPYEAKMAADGFAGCACKSCGSSRTPPEMLDPVVREVLMAAFDP